MKRSVSAIQTFAESPLFIVLSGGCSIVALVGWLYEKLDPAFRILWLVLLCVGVIFLIIGIVYSLRVRYSYMGLRDMCRTFHDISRLLNQSIADAASKSREDRLEIQRMALMSVCQRVASIFTRFIGRECMATIKLVVHQDGKKFLQAYVRSQEQSERDLPAKRLFTLGQGLNTGSDRAVAKNGDDRPAHYFSADLSKEPGYCNERQHFLKSYKSILCVPIRSGIPFEETDQYHGLVGYLSVDTLSVNRLNDGNQLFLLAALALQVYNFMAQMRGDAFVQKGSTSEPVPQGA